MTTEIRRAVPGDAQRILELLRQVAEVHRQGRPDLFRKNATKYVEDEVIDIVINDSTPVFVATLDGTVVGYVFCVISETRNSTMLNDMKNVHLEDVCVDEACRGMGVGSLLMDHVIGWAKSIGCTHMDLDVWEFNEGARRLYERYGFAAQKQRMDMWL